MRARTFIPFIVCLLAAKLAMDRVADVDLFWHIRLGLDMLARKALPSTVEYSWTLAGAPYLANDWLAELGMALAYQLGGFELLSLAKAAVAALLVFTMYLGAFWRSDGNLRAAGLAAALLCFVAATNFIARPVLLGHLCLAAELVLIELALRGKRWAAFSLPAVFALWVNFHGSWPVGMGPLAATAASILLPFSWKRLGSRPIPQEARRPLLLGILLAPLGLLLNPVGPHLLLRPFRLVGRQTDLTVIGEWHPVPWSDPSAWILLGVVLLFVAALLFSRRPLPLWDVGLVGLTMAMAFSTALYHMTFAVMAAPLLAEQLAGRISPEGFPKRRFNLAVALGTALLVALLGLTRLRSVPEDVRRTAPIEAVDALVASGLAGEKGFNYFDWGGYLVFRGVPTFIDGRLEPFLEAGLFTEYIGIEREADVASVEARGVRWVLAPPNTFLSVALSQRPGWQPLFRDETSVLWARVAL